MALAVEEAGRPPSGALAGIMRNTRAQYHRAVKLAKRDELDARRAAMARTINVGNERDFWTELRKLESCNKPCPVSIDGHYEDGDIANNFATKYANLYSSVPTSQEDIHEISTLIENDIRCDTEALYDTIVNVSDIDNAMKQLKHGKSDGSRGTDSDHFIYSSRKFRIQLSLMINAMFIHGYTPSELLESVITSIPKDLRGNLCSGDNYRGIALCSALCKVIDLIIIDKHADKLITSDLQFSFKSDHSTNMCTTVVKEVASYYNARGSDIYVCMLDASKAFDRVNYGKLFKLLMSRKLPAVVLRLILDMYTRQRMCTRWNGAKSFHFGATNGVKQGAILSPILFCVYIDELLNRINRSGIGCHIVHLSYAGCGYADDAGLISPSVTALQKLLCICEKFADEYDVLFNAKKTICIKIGSDGEPPVKPVMLHGSVISWAKCIKHLGNMINVDLSDEADIALKKSSFVSQVNTLNNKFSSMSSLVRGSLLQAYCCSWYGCQNWDLISKPCRQLNIEWNKAVRRTLRVPFCTHTVLLPLLVQNKNFTQQHASRVRKFVNAFCTSDNKHVQLIGKRACEFTTGTLGRNRARCEASIKHDDGSGAPSPDETLAATAQSIRTLLNARDNLLDITGFGYSDINTMLDSLCCC